MKNEFTRGELLAAFSALGEVLEARGLGYEVVLVGGGNLLLRGLISRPTRDADLVGERLPSGRIVPLRSLPEPLRLAIRDVALAYDLRADWLNLGPEALHDLGLPPGFEGRLTRSAFGGLGVWLAGRFDLICFKLYAAADRWPTQDRHLSDLRALRPKGSQLLSAARWAHGHGPSPGFRTLLVAVLRDLGLEEADAALG